MTFQGISRNGAKERARATLGPFLLSVCSRSKRRCWVVEKVPARSAEESREGALRMLLLALVLAYALGQQ